VDSASLKEYTFPYRREYSSLVGEIHRPVAVIYLQAKNKKWIGFTLYADAGADITLLPQSACNGLSYNLKTGKPGYVGGITRGRIKVYVHELNTKLGEEAFKARIAFAQTENIPPLLGRTDIFDHFKVCYNNKQKETIFILL
jgi:hypothetical protein